MPGGKGAETQTFFLHAAANFRGLGRRVRHGEVVVRDDGYRLGRILAKSLGYLVVFIMGLV